MAVSLALGVGGFATVTATDAVTGTEPAAHADAIGCATAVTGYGLTVLGGMFTVGVADWVAWLTLATSGAALGDVAANQQCAGDSFWNHLGHRQLCDQAYFAGWADNGDAVYKPGITACLNYNPFTDDMVMCKYIINYSSSGDMQNQCAQQMAYDDVIGRALDISAYIG